MCIVGGILIDMIRDRDGGRRGRHPRVCGPDAAAAAALPLEASADGTVSGILHIHSTRSDGRGTPDEVAAAAARAGISFIVFTDHGDATRTPDPPTYRSGVLCLDGVEISTAGGHYVVLDMPAAPYPLAGEPRDVVEDVRRLGGFGIAAHPDSPKPELRWSDWDAPVDGIEWINPDTSWRVRAVTGWGPRFSLLEGLLHYPFRPVETLANLLTGFEDTMAHWTSLASGAPVVGVAGADAHAKIDFRNADPGDNRFTIPFPGYEASFRMLSVHVTAGAALSVAGGRRQRCVARDARDPRRTSLYGHRRPGHASRVRIHRDQPAGHRSSGRRARRRRTGVDPRAQQRPGRIHDHHLAGRRDAGVGAARRDSRSKQGRGPRSTVPRCARTIPSPRTGCWATRSMFALPNPCWPRPVPVTPRRRSLTAGPTAVGTSRPTLHRWPRSISGRR